ncbi:MAG: DoxX family protein [Flavobacteriales bacterium]|nr:DoxX family protein [Flavobacteriales bacterium]
MAGPSDGFADRTDKFADPFGIGPTASLALIVFAEVFCAALVVLGLWTRAAPILLIIGMAIVFVVKSGDPFNEMEMPAVYLAMYVVLLFTGSGRYSIDRIKFQ